jgi:hypothetical protein
MEIQSAELQFAAVNAIKSITSSDKQSPAALSYVESNFLKILFVARSPLIRKNVSIAIGVDVEMTDDQELSHCCEIEKKKAFQLQSSLVRHDSPLGEIELC